MMIDIPTLKPLPPGDMIFLTRTAHQWASQFCQRQSDPRKAEQVYVNTLAVWAVHESLMASGIESDLQTSYSWDSVFQTCMNVADLAIPERGHLECRPVMGPATVVTVPPETWDDRLGYVVVRLDENLETATLLGYVATVQAETLDLRQLQDIQELLDQLISRRGAAPRAGSLTHLRAWLQGQIGQGWQALDDAFAQPTPAFAVRTAPLAPVVQQGKYLALLPEGDPLLLMVAIQPTVADWKITVGLSPAAPGGQLPLELTLAVLDAAGEPVMQAQSRATERLILEFEGDGGDCFSTQITLGEMHWVEHFVI